MLFRSYAETRQNILEGNAIPQDIVILRDGFTQFQVKYKVNAYCVGNQMTPVRIFTLLERSRTSGELG